MFKTAEAVYAAYEEAYKRAGLPKALRTLGSGARATEYGHVRAYQNLAGRDAARSTGSLRRSLINMGKDDKQELARLLKNPKAAKKVDRGP